LLISCPNNL